MNLYDRVQMMSFSETEKAAAFPRVEFPWARPNTKAAIRLGNYLTEHTMPFARMNFKLKRLMDRLVLRAVNPIRKLVGRPLKLAPEAPIFRTTPAQEAERIFFGGKR